MTEREIRTMVMRMYPVTPRERQGCVQEIERLKYLREQYRKRLEQGNDNSGGNEDKPKV